MWDLSELRRLLQDFENQFHSISLIQVLDPTERIFDFDRVSEFKDLEGPSKMILDPRTARRLYLDELEAQRKGIRALTESRENIHFYEVSLSETQVEVLEELYADL